MISLQELEKHNTEDDCWVVQHGLVLDLSEDFLNEHPGGPEVITSISGKDVTTDFEDIGHSDDARIWADKYIIGWLEGTEGSEEELKRKIHPKNSDLRVSTKGGGGSMTIFPLAIAIVAAMLSYFFLSKR